MDTDTPMQDAPETAPIIKTGDTTAASLVSIDVKRVRPKHGKHDERRHRNRRCVLRPQRDLPNHTEMLKVQLPKKHRHVLSPESQLGHKPARRHKSYSIEMMAAASRVFKKGVPDLTGVSVTNNTSTVSQEDHLSGMLQDCLLIKDEYEKMTQKTRERD